MHSARQRLISNKALRAGAIEAARRLSLLPEDPHSGAVRAPDEVR